MKQLFVRILVCLGLFMMVMASAAMFWRHPLQLAAFYAVCSILLLVRWHEPEDLIYYFVALVVAPLGELLAIRNGAWRYTDCGLGVPVWLPLAWGLCAASMRRLSLAMVDLARSRGDGGSGSP